MGSSSERCIVGIDDASPFYMMCALVQHNPGGVLAKHGSAAISKVTASGSQHAPLAIFFFSTGKSHPVPRDSGLCQPMG